MNKVPHDINAEKALIGSCLVQPGEGGSLISDISNIVRPKSFYDEFWGCVFGIMQGLVENGRPADLVTLPSELEAQNYEHYECVVKLSDAMESVPSAANAEYYAKIVADMSQRRWIIRSGLEMVKEAEDTSKEADFLTGIDSMLSAISKAENRRRPRPVSESLKGTLEVIDSIATHGHRGIPTGFRDLDEIYTGLCPGELHIIAARPSMGKTTFCCNICENMVYEQSQPIVFYSLEMGEHQLNMNMLGRHSGVAPYRIQRGQFSNDELRQIIDTADRRKTNNLIIADTPVLSFSTIRAQCYALNRQVGLKAICIDYLQLMKLPFRDEVRALGELTRNLKNLARELNVCVVVLSQLSRASTSRDDKKPRLSDLRGSGSIEQDADSVLMLHRPDYYDDGERQGEVDVIIAKQRNGPIGTRTLWFDKALMQMKDFEGVSQPQKQTKANYWTEK